MNTHRAGLLREGRSTQLIASGSQRFCHLAASEHAKKYNGTAYEIVEATEDGKPHGWSED